MFPPYEFVTLSSRHSPVPINCLQTYIRREVWNCDYLEASDLGLIADFTQPELVGLTLSLFTHYELTLQRKCTGFIDNIRRFITFPNLYYDMIGCIMIRLERQYGKGQEMKKAGNYVDKKTEFDHTVN